MHDVIDTKQTHHFHEHAHISEHAHLHTHSGAHSHQHENLSPETIHTHAHTHTLIHEHDHTHEPGHAHMHGAQNQEELAEAVLCMERAIRENQNQMQALAQLQELLRRNNKAGAADQLESAMTDLAAGGERLAESLKSLQE